MSKAFPKKHLTLEQSYLGFGAKLINIINCSESTIEDLWNKCNENGTKHDFDDLILTLDFLFAINAISIKGGGIICLN